MSPSSHPESHDQPIALRLMRTDLPQARLDTPMSEAAAILKARAADGPGTHNPILVVCSGDAVFEGFISLMDVLRWMESGAAASDMAAASAASEDDDEPKSVTTVEARLRHNVVKLHPKDTLDTILSGVANSTAGGCPVVEDHRFQGVILGEDVFSYIASQLLVADL